MTLIRPDGYIAYEADHLDESAPGSVGSLLERQTNQVEGVLP
jgi:hypothetical protein